MSLALAALCSLLQADPDALAQRIVAAFAEPDKTDPADEAAARLSPAFGPRYAELLLEIHRSVARDGGYEAVFRSLTQFSTAGGPKGAIDHVRALAMGFKKAVYCKECRDGKVACGDCKGKGRVDQLKCAVCSGVGRVRPSGAIGAADVSVKCRNCEGRGTFKDAGCPSCARSGLRNCPACLGRPWHDRKCSVAECQSGRIRCLECAGKGKVHPRCAECEGKGRFRASGAVGNAEVTVKCRGCEGKGASAEPVACAACGSDGFTPCKACRTQDRPQFRVTLAGILTATPCGRCAKCAGLGLRIQPAGDPSKTLD